MSDGNWSPVEPPYDPAVDGPTPDDAAFMEDPFSEPGPHEPTAAARENGQPVQQKPQGRGPTQSAELVEMAKELYRVVKSTEGKIYAVKHEHPGIALDIRGKAGLRQQLSSIYYNKKKRTASDTAIKEMLNVLEGDALAAAEEPVFLRFADNGNGQVFIDLGTPEGQVIEVTRNGWKLLDHSPVLFRRSNLMSPIPRPLPNGSLDGLRNLINVSDSGFRLLVGWMVAACIPDIPHPLLALIGQQGTAKTTALKMLIMLISPSPAPVGSAPTTPDDWAVNAYQEPVIGLDNVSNLPPWFQDALCKAVTGDGYKKREKYSDSESSVLQFKRVIGMTSIDPGSLQGDVSDRLLQVELDPIPKTGRRTEKDVANEFEQVRQSAHGAILDLLALVLGTLPAVHLDEMPRMADFARVLAALDKVTGWQTLPDYLQATTTAAADVIEGNLFASAIRDLVMSHNVWKGTATELLAEISPSHPPQKWPKTPSQASGSLRRSLPALATVGVIYTELPRKSGQRLFVLSKHDVPLCSVCFTAMSKAMLEQGITTHPGCTEPTELFNKD